MLLSSSASVAGCAASASRAAMMFSSVPSTSTTLLSAVSGVWAQTGSAVVPIMAAAKTRAKIRLSFFIFSSLEYSQKPFLPLYILILNFTRNRGEIQCQTHQHPAQKKFSDFTFFNKKAIFSRAKWCIMIQNMGVCVHFGTPRRQRGRNGVSGTFPLPEQPPTALAPHPQLVDKRRMTF